MTSNRAVTELLDAIRQGDAAAAAELYEQVHGKLHRLAHGAMRRERAGHTLQTTALVNEAYLKMVGGEQPGWQNRVHFLATAARAMRQVLVEYARKKNAQKRDGGERVELLDHPATFADDQLATVLAVDEALRNLEEVDERACRVVELRFFAGLELTEIGEVLEISERSARRDWKFARAWLHDAMSE